MLLSAEAMRLFVDTLGLMCLLAASYGTVSRATREPWLFCWVMGTLFGVTAVLAMHNPMQISEGVQGDLRAVPMVLAGAYLGWRGALAAAGLAVVTRLEIGGAGMLPGCMGILIAVGVGLSWSWLARRPRRQGSQRTRLCAKAGLAVLSASYLLTGLLLPADVAWRLVTTLWPNLLPLHLTGVVIVAMVLEREQALLDAQRRLAEEAGRDPLTRLLNRRGFEEAVARARPEFTGAALLLLDLDHFKQVNDLHGHAAGDAVLRQLGGRLQRALQGQGVVGRLGGEEIAVFLPSILPPEAMRVAERLRQAVRSVPFALPCGASRSVTVSIGGASRPSMEDLDALLARADLGLYAAKRGGRDRCCMNVEPPAGDAGPAVATCAPPGPPGAVPRRRNRARLRQGQGLRQELRPVRGLRAVRARASRPAREEALGPCRPGPTTPS